MGLSHAGRISVRRPVSEGYMVEDIEVFHGVVPDGIEPQNQDGEVERFECLTLHALEERLASGACTLEASLIFGLLIDQGVLARSIGREERRRQRLSPRRRVRLISCQPRPPSRISPSST